MSTIYHAKYYAEELTKRCPSDSLDKLAVPLSDARVDLNPHQIEAALFAFRSPFSKGAILADEVGLGKTIEAGILLAQKWAEHQRRLLVIVPASLRKQWAQELADKFFLPSTIMENQSFVAALEENKRHGRGYNFGEGVDPLLLPNIVICSYQFAAARQEYVKRVDWDLVVIDEAHRLRNVYKPTSKIANAIKNGVAKAPKILLTATPLQNSLIELYGLVSIIDEYTFGDLGAFKTQFTRLTDDCYFDDLQARLAPICKRTLRRQVLEYVKYTNRIPITQEFIPSEAEQRLYDLVSDYLRRPTLYALPNAQRHLMTLILRKLLASSSYAIAVTLEGLSTRLQHMACEGMRALQASAPEIGENFETFGEMEEEWKEDDSREEAEEAPRDTSAAPLLSAAQIREIEQEIAQLQECAGLAQSITRNAKGDVLLTALKRGFEKAEELGAPRKAVIFTESARTQKYLLSLLETTEFAGKIVLFNGSNSDAGSTAIYQNWLEQHAGTERISGVATADKRAALVEYFQNEAEIMIATEAAAEGINLQFCSLLVNYDLPWNPQRIEQRIGRCHRYGQKFDVVVVNFLNNANEADQRVYQILFDKFKLFDGVFGASDEILGTIESGVGFEKRIAQIYDECRTPEQIDAEFNALQSEMEEQIRATLSDTRRKLLENFDEEVSEKLRVNLQESQAVLGKFETWLWRMTRFFLARHAFFDDEPPSFVLHTNPFPGEPIPEGPYGVGKEVGAANHYRIGHPLAQRIVAKCKKLVTPLAALSFDSTSSAARITILEPLKGKSGWLTCERLTLQAMDAEDHVLLAGCDDEGNILLPEQCQRLFSLEAEVADQPPRSGECGAGLQHGISSGLHAQREQIFESLQTRNGRYFDAEMEKLDRWSEDLKLGLEREIKEMDQQIKEARRAAAMAQTLGDKLAGQKQVKALEARRTEKRRSLFDAQDKVDQQREAVIGGMEAKLVQKSQSTTLFTIRWKVV